MLQALSNLVWTLPGMEQLLLTRLAINFKKLNSKMSEAAKNTESLLVT